MLHNLFVLKQVFFFSFLFLFPVLLFAQQPDSIIAKKNSGANKDSSHGFKKNSSSDLKTDSSPGVKNDTSVAILPDSVIIKSDSVSGIKKDTIINRSATYYIRLQKILKENRFLNSTGKPVAMVTQIKKQNSADSFFYILAAITLMLGFFRFFYTRYFNNLFRVFFNASLRQSQLTDQLLQAKLPSLFFNILFILTGGMYVYLLLRYYNWISDGDFGPTLFYCTLSLGIIYLVKFVTVKFTGWLTGYKEVTNIYVFIIFLINKILGILLVPFSIIIAFSVPPLITAAVIISLLLICLMFLLRFFRSYGLLQHQLKISRFHFFMYVVGIEIVPVLLIYKGLVLLLSKNL
ncbi:MAG: DUF4271 domain-containing protein [Ferruginibacter sp.]